MFCESDLRILGFLSPTFLAEHLIQITRYVETFDFIDAPHPARGVDEEIDSDIALSIFIRFNLSCRVSSRGWWFSRSDSRYRATDEVDDDVGFDESTRLIIEKLREGSYDGLLGFSQGACWY